MDAEDRPGFESLTEREREVIALMGRGLTNGQIAEHLGISFETAKWHVAHIISKTGAATREEAVGRYRAHQRPAARLKRHARAVLAIPLLGKTATIAAGSLLTAAAVAVGAVAYSFSEGGEYPGPAGPNPAAGPSATTVALVHPTIVAPTPTTTDAAWWDELRTTLLLNDQLEYPVSVATEATFEGVTWQVGAVTEIRHCLVTLRERETEFMSCAGGDNFPNGWSAEHGMSELVAHPIVLGDFFRAFGYAGLAPASAAYVEFETESAVYSAPAVYRADITTKRSFFIFAFAAPAKDGTLRAFAADGELLGAVDLEAPFMLPPGEMPGGGPTSP